MGGLFWNPTTASPHATGVATFGASGPHLPRGEDLDLRRAGDVRGSGFWRVDGSPTATVGSGMVESISQGLLVLGEPYHRTSF